MDDFMRFQIMQILGTAALALRSSKASDEAIYFSSSKPISPPFALRASLCDFFWISLIVRACLFGPPAVEEVLAAPILFDQDEIFSVFPLQRLYGVGHVLPASVASHFLSWCKRADVFSIRSTQNVRILLTAFRLDHPHEQIVPSQINGCGR